MAATAYRDGGATLGQNGHLGECGEMPILVGGTRLGIWYLVFGIWYLGHNRHCGVIWHFSTCCKNKGFFQKLLNSSSLLPILCTRFCPNAPCRMCISREDPDAKWISDFLPLAEIPTRREVPKLAATIWCQLDCGHLVRNSTTNTRDFPTNVPTGFGHKSLFPACDPKIHWRFRPISYGRFGGSHLVRISEFWVFWILPKGVSTCFLLTAKCYSKYSIRRILVPLLVPFGPIWPQLKRFGSQLVFGPKVFGTTGQNGHLVPQLVAT